MFKPARKKGFTQQKYVTFVPSDQRSTPWSYISVIFLFYFVFEQAFHSGICSECCYAIYYLIFSYLI